MHPVPEVYGSWLERLIASKTKGEFLSRNWPLIPLWSHADPSRLGNLLDNRIFDSVDSVLGAVSGTVRVWRTDRDGRFQNLNIPVDELLLEGVGGALTVVVDSLERRVEIPVLNELLVGLESDLCTPQGAISCNLYFSRANTQTAAHFDEQEVFLLQLRGEKEWTIARNQHITFPSQHFNSCSGTFMHEIALLAENTPLVPKMEGETDTLRPGSVLFLPRGTWHWGETVSDSIGLTLSFASLTWLDLTLAELRSRLLHHEEWRKPAVAARSAEKREYGIDLGEMLKSLSLSVSNLRAVDLQEGVFDIAPAPGRRYRLESDWKIWIDDTCNSSCLTLWAERFDDSKRISIELDCRYLNLLTWLVSLKEPFSLPAAIRSSAFLAQRDVAKLIGVLCKINVLSEQMPTP